MVRTVGVFLACLFYLQFSSITVAGGTEAAVPLRTGTRESPTVKRENNYTGESGWNKSIKKSRIQCDRKMGLP